MTGTSRYDLHNCTVPEILIYLRGWLDGRQTRALGSHVDAHRPTAPEYTSRSGWAYQVGHQDGQDDVIAIAPGDQTWEDVLAEAAPTAHALWGVWQIYAQEAADLDDLAAGLRSLSDRLDHGDLGPPMESEGQTGVATAPE